MQLTEEIKKTTLSVLSSLGTIVTPSLKIGAKDDVFSLVSFDYNYQALTMAGNNRLKGTFDMDFLVSPAPPNKEPLNDYDSIINHFESTYPLLFKNAGIQVFNVTYGSATYVVDKTTGISSVIFSVNIVATIRKQ